MQKIERLVIRQLIKQQFKNGTGSYWTMSSQRKEWNKLLKMSYTRLNMAKSFVWDAIYHFAVLSSTFDTKKKESLVLGREWNERYFG